MSPGLWLKTYSVFQTFLLSSLFKLCSENISEIKHLSLNSVTELKANNMW